MYRMGLLMEQEEKLSILSLMIATWYSIVNFDNQQVGIKAIQTSPDPYQANFPDAVPLGKHEVVFRAKRKCGSEITRLQFPLTLAWATTIHKVHGLILDEKPLLTRKVVDSIQGKPM